MNRSRDRTHTRQVCNNRTRGVVLQLQPKRNALIVQIVLHIDAVRIVFIEKNRVRSIAGGDDQEARAGLILLAVET